MKINLDNTLCYTKTVVIYTHLKTSIQTVLVSQKTTDKTNSVICTASKTNYSWPQDIKWFMSFSTTTWRFI